jgi:hypothetical protein
MSDSMIRWKCSGCQTVLTLVSGEPGQTAVCPDCKTTQVVPATSTVLPPGATACPKCGAEAAKIHWNASTGSGQIGVQANIAKGHPALALLGAGWLVAKAALSTRYVCTNTACRHEWRVW